jgi:acetyl-CoA synthetase
MPRALSAQDLIAAGLSDLNARALADLNARALADPNARALSDLDARALAEAFEALRAQTGLGSDLWQRLTAGVLGPGSAWPWPVHQAMHAAAYADWDESRGPPPAWLPDPAAAARTNVGRLMALRGLSHFEDLHAFSVRLRAEFWTDALTQLRVVFRERPVTVLDPRGGARNPRWLPAARFNIVESCLAGDPTAPAIISADAQGELTTLTYGALAAEVARVAAGLRAAGFTSGDAVAIDMPMTTAAVVIYLGLVWAGLRVVSIADSLAAGEVATRLRIAGAVGLFTALAIDRGGKRLPLYEKLLAAQPPRAIVIDAGGASLRPGDLTWEAFLAAGDAEKPVPAAVGGPETITNILFSSGTTGDPKAIPWTQLTPIKAAADAAYHFDVQPDDVVAWPTNLGWMMGPWLIYASLINRATMALFTDAPTGRSFGEFVARARVTVLGLVPSIVKAWRSDDRMRGLDWSALKCFGSTGEASNAVDYLYLMSLAGYRPVIEYCGGTEIGGGYLTGSLLQAASPATFSTPALGSELVILDEAGQPTDNGEVFLIPPTLGYSSTLLNRDHDEVYYAGTPDGPGGVPLRRHGDQIQRLPGGRFRALGRVDDTMNLGGIKVSSAEIERTLDEVPGVRRSAAIAINPAGGGPSELVIYAVIDGFGAGVAATDQQAWLPRLQQAVKERLNPLFRISDLVLVDTLPVTASNKIMRRELRADHERRVG